MTPPDSIPATIAAPASIVRDSIPADSIPADSIPTDSLAFGVVLTPPSPPAPAAQRANDDTGLSIVLGTLLLLFCIVALRVRNNGRYLSSLLYDLTEVRERHNVFDDTVRETSLLVLLNLLWCFSAGVLLWAAIVTFTPPSPSPAPPPGMAICAAVTLCYELVMATAYYIIGNVFNDRQHARMWLRGFLASQAIASIPFFATALLVLTRPDWTTGLLIAAAVTLVIAKLLFIWKGFRIFFTRISSWVLFLYYLCSLEIIPLILTYVAATILCGSLTSLHITL